MIYYLQNPENFIKCANQILKNNGNIFISMVNSKMTFLEKIRLLLVKKGIKGVYVDDGIREFLPLSTLLDFLKKYDFKINYIDRQVVIPLKFFDPINRIIERSPIKNLCYFIIVKASKNTTS